MKDGIIWRFWNLDLKKEGLCLNLNFIFKKDSRSGSYIFSLILKRLCTGNKWEKDCGINQNFLIWLKLWSTWGKSAVGFFSSHCHRY